MQKNYTQIIEALKKVAVRLIKLLINDNINSDGTTELMITAQWQNRIREEIDRILRYGFI